jgi:hypothetical protein
MAKEINSESLTKLARKEIKTKFSEFVKKDHEFFSETINSGLSLPETDVVFEKTIKLYCQLLILETKDIDFLSSSIFEMNLTKFIEVHFGANGEDELTPVQTVIIDNL